MSDIAVVESTRGRGSESEDEESDREVDRRRVREDSPPAAGGDGGGGGGTDTAKATVLVRELEALPAGDYMYFIAKPRNHYRMSMGIELSVWSSKIENADRLSAAHASGKPVVVFFSVNGSHHMQGYAQMVSAATQRVDSGLPCIYPDAATFSLEWRQISDVPWTAASQLKNTLNDNLEVKVARDMQEVDAATGAALLDVFNSTAAAAAGTPPYTTDSAARAKAYSKAHLQAPGDQGYPRGHELFVADVGALGKPVSLAPMLMPPRSLMPMNLMGVAGGVAPAPGMGPGPIAQVGQRVIGVGVGFGPGAFRPPAVPYSPLCSTEPAPNPEEARRRAVKIADAILEYHGHSHSDRGGRGTRHRDDDKRRYDDYRRDDDRRRVDRRRDDRRDHRDHRDHRDRDDRRDHRDRGDRDRRDRRRSRSRSPRRSRKSGRRSASPGGSGSPARQRQRPGSPPIDVTTMTYDEYVAQQLSSLGTAPVPMAAGGGQWAGGAAPAAWGNNMGWMGQPGFPGQPGGGAGGQPQRR